MKKIFATEFNLIKPEEVKKFRELCNRYTGIITTHLNHEDITDRIGIPAVEFEVTECGLNIYHNGIMMDKWEEYKARIRNELSNEIMSVHFDISEEFEAEADRIEFKEGLITVVKYSKGIHDIDERMNIFFQEWPKFTSVNVGNTLFIMPTGISKGIAVRFIYNMIKANELIVFGENESDLSLLAIADKAYVHSGSELLGKHVEAARVYSSLSEVVKEITE